MSTAATAQIENGHDQANGASVALPLRNDTFLGVCEAIGQDFGFNPNWLRVVFAPFILISPLFTLAAYFALGGFVLLSRRLYPAVRKDASPASDAHQAEKMDESEERLAA
jgi:phage shock protein C